LGCTLADLTDEFECIGVGGTAQLEAENNGRRRSVAVKVTDVGQVTAQR
jgi:hypothetical protein